MSTTPAPLPLSDIVNVTVNISPQAPAQPTFNIGLIVGISTVIGTTERVREYSSGTWAAQMVTDGFTTSSPEYLAAALYFGQSPAPQFVFIGRQNSGTESCLQAIQACRAANSQWYGAMVIGAAAADHSAIVAWAQGAQPRLFYFGGTSDAAVLAGSGGNILSVLKTASYEHSLMVYSTLQQISASPLVNANPNAPYVASAVMGALMGLNSGLAGSYFTPKFKTIIGIVAEPLTEAQKAIIEGNNGNLILTYGNAYTFFEQGVMPNGWFADLRFNIDMLVSNLQYGEMNVLRAAPAVPQTDPGQALLLHAADQACDLGASVGFIAGGTWTGGTVNAANGQALIANQQPLPKGYICVSPPYSTQATSDRAARNAMPIYIFLIYAGAAHFVQIQVNVQQ